MRLEPGPSTTFSFLSFDFYDFFFKFLGTTCSAAWSNRVGRLPRNHPLRNFDPLIVFSGKNGKLLLFIYLFDSKESEKYFHSAKSVQKMAPHWPVHPRPRRGVKGMDAKWALHSAVPQIFLPPPSSTSHSFSLCIANVAPEWRRAIKRKGTMREEHLSSSPFPIFFHL